MTISLTDVDKESPVLVTGATGYVAGVLVKELLSLGLVVHGTVRDLSRPHLTKHLPPSDNLKLFECDLLVPGSFSEAMKNCRVVFHVASPHVLDPVDPQEELIGPAVEGTKNILTEIGRHDCVDCVVLTSSSCVLASCEDEMSWNTSATLEQDPYVLSKRLAETTARKTAAAMHDRYRLIVLHPTTILGPGVHYHWNSESVQFFQQLALDSSGGCPNIGLGIVDVRDVVEAHIRAAFCYKNEQPGDRHILNGHNTTYWEMVQILKRRYADYPLPKRCLPKWVAWAFASKSQPYRNRRFIRQNANVTVKWDNSKSIDKFQMEYRELSETLWDMFQQMVEAGAAHACPPPPEKVCLNTTLDDEEELNVWG